MAFSGGTLVLGFPKPPPRSQSDHTMHGASYTQAPSEQEAGLAALHPCPRHAMGTPPLALRLSGFAETEPPAQHSTEDTEGPRLPCQAHRVQAVPLQQQAARAICPHTGRQPQQSWSCKYPIRAFSEPFPQLPQQPSICRHSACALAPEPRARLFGQRTNSTPHPPISGWSAARPPCCSLGSGPSRPMCVYVCMCAHTCVNMILWRAESSRKFFCSEVISATPVQASIWAT